MVKLILLTCIALPLTIACTHPASHHPVRAVRIASSIPIITADTSYTIDDSYDIFYFNDMVMYKFKYRYDSLVNYRPVVQEWRPNYVVFHEDSSFGYSYIRSNDKIVTGDRISVDTILQRNAFHSINPDSLFDRKPDSSFIDKEKDLVKVYSPAPSERYPEQFTYYLYYSKEFVGINEPFFPGFGAPEKGKRLFRVRMIAHGHYYEDQKITLPRREFTYEMREIAVDNEAEVMSYFERYNRDIGK